MRIVIADKIFVYFKPKNGNKRDKYGYYIKRTIHQEYITVYIYIYIYKLIYRKTNIGKPKYKSIKYEQIYKEKLTAHK